MKHLRVSVCFTMELPNEVGTYTLEMQCSAVSASSSGKT